MFQRIASSPTKKLIGQKTTLSFSENKTFALWNKFMPRKKEIKNVIGSELFSVEIYPDNFFSVFNPITPFEKWAAVEVSENETVPTEMESLIIQEGWYAVFIHKGLASDGPITYNYIFKEWLPQSEYELDNRPHMAIMGEKYKNDSPDSEEEIWIPVKEKVELV